MNEHDMQASRPTVSPRLREGMPWTEQECRELVDRVRSGIPDEDIAVAHQRSVGGIQSRVNRLLPDESRGARVDATNDFRALPDDYDLDAAIFASLARRATTKEPLTIEAAVSRYIKHRARAEAQLLDAIAQARRDGIDPDTLRLILARAGTIPSPPDALGEMGGGTTTNEPTPHPAA